MSEAKERLERAAHAIHTAVMLVKMEQETIEAFLKECRDMQNFGHIVDPTLFNKSQRRAVEALLKPTFEAALDFMHKHETHTAAAKAALAKVQP